LSKPEKIRASESCRYCRAKWHFYSRHALILPCNYLAAIYSDSHSQQSTRRIQCKWMPWFPRSLASWAMTHQLPQWECWTTHLSDFFRLLMIPFCLFLSFIIP
jgi:hypothetical protein